MKMKFVRDLKTDRRELLVASQRGETLSTKQAEKLAVTASVLLINFSFEKPRANGLTTLHYDVEGLWSLRTYLAKRSLGVEELMGLLEAMQGVLDLCTSEHLHPEGLLFDPEYVFVNSQCCPRFVLLPLEGAPFQTRNSPLALLQALGNTDSLRFETPDAEGLSRRLGDLVVDLEGVFSANRFRRFLEQEQSLDDDTPPEARNSVVEPGTSSVWASVGGGNSSSAPDAGAFFWNPLAGLAEEEAPAPATRPEPAPVESKPVAPPEPAPVASQPAPPAPTAPQPVVLQPASAPAPPAAPVSLAPQPAAPVGNLWLVRLATGERFPLPLGQQVRAGRGSACEIRLLNNRKLSRTHVALTSTGQMLMVTDQGAANGVFVDGQRVSSMQSVLLTPGQRLRMADEDFDVRLG